MFYPDPNLPLVDLPRSDSSDPGSLIEALAAIERLDDAGASIEVLHAELRKVHRGFRVRTPCFDPGMSIFRARKVNSRPVNIDDVGYPPTEKTPMNRLNEKSDPIFYGSLGSAAACLYECDVTVGDRFAVSSWVSCERIMCMQFGFFGGAMDKWKGQRNYASTFERPTDNPLGDELAKWQSKIFTRQVPRGSESLYRLSIALARFGMDPVIEANGSPGLFGGIVYPSVAMNLFGENIALLPSIADSCLELREVHLLKIDGVVPASQVDARPGSVIHYELLDSAFGCDDGGNLSWQTDLGPFPRVQATLQG